MNSHSDFGYDDKHCRSYSSSSYYYYYYYYYYFGVTLLPLHANATAFLPGGQKKISSA